ncbi:MAG: hypothetical protein DMG59_18210 [Acidobacteria bacterium]|jgi:hypothetical protein|nr:MAG: hypothetical protein DMG59_18210 [Acidobacteriota bacterium]
MRTIIKLFIIFGLGSTLSFAETWTGKLVDAACKDRSKRGSQMTECTPSSATTSFGIELEDGKVLKLDSTGNAKASEAIKSTGTKSSMQATVTGSLQGQTVKVESIDIQ